MASRKTIAIIAILIILGIGYYFLYLNKPKEEQKAEQPKDATDELAQYVKEFPTGPLTMVQIKPNQLIFANETGVHQVYLIREVVFANNAVFDIDGHEFHLEIDDESNKFYIYGVNNDDITDYSTDEEVEKAFYNPFYLVYEGPIEYNKFSDDVINFRMQNIYLSEFESDENEPLPAEYFKPFIEKYRYFIEEDKSGNAQHLIHFVLEKQGFELQFGKKMEFSGSDKTGNGNVNVDYYLPDSSWAGNAEKDSKKIVSFLKIDENNDGKYDIEAYIDNETHSLLETPNSKLPKYPYSVKFDNTGITSANVKKTDAYGSHLWIENNILSARLIVK